MDPDRYCQDRVTTLDPSARLCLLFADPARQAAATALFALSHELHEGLAGTQDESVARTKLQWWRDEIRRCAAGTPQHPVTRALAPAVSRHHLPLARLLEMTDAAETDIVHPGFDDLQALIDYCDHGWGALYMLAGRVLGARRRDTERFAQNAGIGARLVEIIRDAPRDAGRGRIHVPGELLRRHGVAAGDLSEPDASPAVRAALAELGRVARERLERARALLPVAERAGQRPLVLLTVLHDRLLARLQRHGYRVFSDNVEIPPLLRLWTVWRTARQEVRVTRRAARAESEGGHP